jgi:hypothetical protein
VGSFDLVDLASAIVPTEFLSAILHRSMRHGSKVDINIVRRAVIGTDRSEGPVPALHNPSHMSFSDNPPITDSTYQLNRAVLSVPTRLQGAPNILRPALRALVSTGTELVPADDNGEHHDQRDKARKLFQT